MSFAVAEGRLWFRDGLCVMTVLVHVSLFCLKPLRYQELQIYMLNNEIFTATEVYTMNDGMFSHNTSLNTQNALPSRHSFGVGHMSRCDTYLKMVL